MNRKGEMEKVQQNGDMGIETTQADELLNNWYEKYGSFLQTYIDRIDAKEIHDAFHWYGINTFSFSMILGHISDSLGIEAPTVIESVGLKPHFKYNRKDNTIYVVHPDSIEELDGVLNESNAMEMLAHETWHAYQYHQIDNGDKRALELYKDDGEKQYLDKSKEQEAFIFGIMSRNKLNEYRLENTKRELNKTIGAISEMVSSGNDAHPRFSEFLEDKKVIKSKIEEIQEDLDRHHLG